MNTVKESLGPPDHFMHYTVVQKETFHSLVKPCERRRGSLHTRHSIIPPNFDSFLHLYTVCCVCVVNVEYSVIWLYHVICGLYTD